MNIKHIISLTSLAVCAALSTSALAQQLVHFEGQITNDSCTATVGGSGNTVTLPNVTLATLTSNTTAGRTAFNVALSGCVPASGNYQINFSQATSTNGRLTNTSAATGKAENVTLRLLSNTATPTALVVTPAPSYARIPVAQDPGIDTTGGSGTGTYHVEYYNEGGATSGEVRASAVMTMNYL